MTDVLGPSSTADILTFANEITSGLLEYMDKEQWQRLRTLPDEVLINTFHTGAKCCNCTLHLSITAFAYHDVKAQYGISYYCLACANKCGSGQPATNPLRQIRLISDRDLQCVLYLVDTVHVTSHGGCDAGAGGTPSVTQHEYEPFTPDEWNYEAKLFDPHLCVEKKNKTIVNVYNLLTGKASENKYVHINLYPTEDGKRHSRLYRMMRTERQNEWQVIFQREHQDLSSSTLVLVYRCTTKLLGTNFHLDWMQAVNIALALLPSVVDKIDRGSSDIGGGECFGGGESGDVDSKSSDIGGGECSGGGESGDVDSKSSDIGGGERSGGGESGFVGAKSSDIGGGECSGGGESGDVDSKSSDIGGGECFGGGESGDSRVPQKGAPCALLDNRTATEEVIRVDEYDVCNVKVDDREETMFKKRRREEQSSDSPALFLPSFLNTGEGTNATISESQKTEDVPVKEIDSNAPLAEWYFIHPDCIDAWMEKLQRLGKTIATCPGNTSSSIANFRQWFQEFQAVYGSEKVFKVYQCHGQKVSVAPGWGHAVLNLRPNVKLAWDHCLSKNLRIYIASWKRHAHFSGLKVRGDYAVLEHHIVEMSRFAYDKLLRCRHPGLLRLQHLVMSHHMHDHEEAMIDDHK
jgi:hypothetical protein